MAKKKAEKLTETQIERTYEIVKGFNTSDGKRFDAGNAFVTEKDFKPEDFKALLEMEALRLVENVEVREDEVVIFERIEE